MGPLDSLTTNSMRLMERSLDYLWTKQAAHLDNLANAETPGYKAKTVSFEERFERKLRAASRTAQARKNGGLTLADIRRTIEDVGWRVEEDDEQTRMDENGVNLLEQMLEATRTAYQIQYVMQAISSDFTTLNHAITG